MTLTKLRETLCARIEAYHVLWGVDSVCTSDVLGMLRDAYLDETNALREKFRLDAALGHVRVCHERYRVAAAHTAAVQDLIRRGFAELAGAVSRCPGGCGSLTRDEEE